MKQTTKIIIIGLGVVVLLAAGWFVFAKTAPTNKKTKDQDITLEGKNAVATVNGETVTSEEVVAMQNLFQEQDQEVSEKEALEQVINQKLIYQAVEENNYSVSTQEAETVIKEQLTTRGIGLEEYKQQITEQGTSYEKELEQVKKQLAVQNYLSDAVPESALEVSEEEGQEFYQTYQEQQSPEEIDSYEKLEPQIIATLEQQKEQQAINSLVQSLRAEAEIKYL